MAYIYKITNIQNKKTYIGKTEYLNPRKRFEEHKRNKNIYPERLLYKAMNEFGLENFSFEVVEKTDNPVEREIYWIEKTNSFKDGYNSTIGGEGAKKLIDEEVIAFYLNAKSATETALYFNCSQDGVLNILKNNEIEIVKSGDSTRANYGKKVIMIDSKSKEEIKIFESQQEAAKYLIENKYSNIKAENYASLASKISLVCRGKRKTCCGFVWKRAE